MTGCVICAEPLRRAEQQTCHGCLHETAALLSGVLTMWAELPQHRGHLHGLRPGTGRGSDTSIPGGDVLVLAGPGGSGAARRRLRGGEARVGIRWWLNGRVGPVGKLEWERLERARLGREHAEDNHLADAPSVAQMLAQWEDDWRHLRGEPAAVVAGGVGATVRAAGRYLTRHHTWAAREHDAFGDYRDDLAALHGRLERATGRAVDIVRANVDCLECGRALVKQLDTAGRQSEDFTCEGCGRVWTEQRYHLALSAELQQQRNRAVVDGVQFATPTLVAAVLGRPVATVRSWEQLGLLRRHLHRGVLLVAVDDAAREHEQRATRTRRAS